MRRRPHISAVAALAVCSVAGALPASANSDLRSGLVPAGTPYAAEALAQITGYSELSVHYSGTTRNVCEAKSASYRYTEVMSATWLASYPQVTVPVATYQQLGAAYPRLHVDPTPTSPGTGGIVDAGWAVKGQAPTESTGTAKTDCATQPFNHEGTYRPTAPGVTVRTVVARNAALGDTGPPDVEVSVFNLAGAGPVSEPASWSLPAGGSTDMVQELDEIATGLPQPELRQAHDEGVVAWGELVLASAPQAYAPLATQNSVTIGPLSAEGTVKCDGGGGNAVSQSQCSVTYHISYWVKLHKRFLYTTKRAYPR